MTGNKQKPEVKREEGQIWQCWVGGETEWEKAEWEESTVKEEHRFASLEYSSSENTCNIITLLRCLLLSRKLQEFSELLSNLTVRDATISRDLDSIHYSLSVQSPATHIWFMWFHTQQKCSSTCYPF